MEINKSDINGVYLVIDPSVNRTILLEKIRQALEGGTDILQVWNHWPAEMSRQDKEQLIAAILDLSQNYDVPVLINDAWKLLKSTGLDGVHFDEIPGNFSQIRQEISREFIAGITCGNNLDVVRWADENDFDYISFCAIFPSASVGSCEIVRPETVQKARKITSLPLFLSGGITPDKIGDLQELDFDGVAVISGILNAEDPRGSASDYKAVLNNSGQKN